MKDLSQVYRNLGPVLRSHVSLSVFNIEGTLSEEEWQSLEVGVARAGFIIHDPHGTPAPTLARIHEWCAEAEAEQVILGGSAEGIQDLFRLGLLQYEDIAGFGCRGTSDFP